MMPKWNVWVYGYLDETKPVAKYGPFESRDLAEKCVVAVAQNIKQAELYSVHLFEKAVS